MKRTLIIISMLILLVISIFVFSKTDQTKEYEVLKKEYLSQNFAGDVFTFYRTYGRLPENNDTLLNAIQEAMRASNIQSYMKYRKDPFQEGDNVYYYLPMYDKQNKSGFVILSAGADGMIDNKSVKYFSDLVLAENKPELDSQSMKANQDILIGYYEFDSLKKLNFKEVENYWLIEANPH